MTARVAMGLRVVEWVGSRLDPTEPVPVGVLARELGAPLSGTSRLCGELEDLGLLERGPAYGTYRLGREAIRLSGAAAAPYTLAVRYALTRVAQETGETVCLAAPSAGGMRVISVVESPWTLHAAADVGEAVDEGAITRAAQRWAADTFGGATVGSGGAQTVETTTGKRVEVAAPVLAPTGECVAVIAVRLPVYRAKRGAPQAAAALTTARRIIERALAAGSDGGDDLAADPVDGSPSALRAAVSILNHLAGRSDTLAGTASATGLRPDRARRLIDSCLRSGLVVGRSDGVEFALAWAVHGWYRAATAPTLVERGTPFVANTAVATGACAFLTVLKGMRSFTLVEELAVLGEGLRMRPWLGKPHPIVGSDGGPTLVMDLRAEELAEIFPSRHTPQEFDAFLERVRRVSRDDVLSMGSIEELGITSISAPVRDASGTVAAAACIVGATEYMRPQLAEMERATRDLATRVTALLI
jgi:DNA-binding IclR family transcriptional regulator